MRMNYLNTLKQSLKELKFPDDFSSKLVEILKQRKFEEFEILLDKKIKELLQQVGVETIDEFNDFFELMKEDISEKKEKIKELVKERNKFEEWSYDWTEKEGERQRFFKELNKAIKEKKQYEELDKKIQYLLKLKSNIQNIKNEITKNFQTQAKPKIKSDFKKIYKKTSSKNISQEKNEEIIKKLSFEEEFTKLTNKEKLNWIISNKDKVSAKDWLKLLTKIDFTKLSESDQDKYLELQEDWEEQVKTVLKQKSEKEYSKYGIFSVPVKNVAINLEAWNTWNKEIDKKIWFLLSNIFWSYDEFLNYVEDWKIGCKIVEEFKKKYPSYKNVISEIQTFFVNNFVKYKKFKKLSFDVIKSIIEELEKEWKGVKLGIYHFNTLLYKSRNLDEAKWIVEKFGSQIKFNEATLKLILSKCEYLHQFEELRNAYFSEVELLDSFVNLVSEKFWINLGQQNNDESDLEMKEENEIEEKEVVNKTRWRNPEKFNQVLEKLDSVSSWEEFYKIHIIERIYINQLNEKRKKIILKKIVNVLSKILKGSEQQAFGKIRTVKSYLEKVKKLNLKVDLSVLENTIALWENQFIEKLNQIKKEVLSYDSFKDIFEKYYLYSSWIVTIYKSKEKYNNIKQAFLEFFKLFLDKLSKLEITESDKEFLIKNKVSYIKTINYMVEILEANDENYQVPKIPLYSCSLDDVFLKSVISKKQEGLEESKNLELEEKVLKLEEEVKNLKEENQKLQAQIDELKGQLMSLFGKKEVKISKNTVYKKNKKKNNKIKPNNERLVSKNTDVYFPSRIQELENMNTFQEFRRRWGSLCPSFRSLNLDKYTNKDKVLNTWLKIYDALEKVLTPDLRLNIKEKRVINTIIDKISQLKQDFEVSKTILEEELLIKELSKKTDRIYVKKTIENIEKANNLDEFFDAWRAYWKSIIQTYRTWTNTEKAFNTWKKIYDKLVLLMDEKNSITDGRRKRVIRTVVLNLRKLDEKFQVDDKIKKILESNKNKEKLALEKNNSSKSQKVVNVEKEIWTKQQIKKEVQAPKNQNKVSNNFQVENKVSDNKEKNIDEVLKNYYERTWKSQKQEKKINSEDIFKNIQPKKQTSIEEIQSNPDKFFQVIINNLGLGNKKWPGNKTWYKIWLERLDKYFELYESLSDEQIEKLLPKLKWWDILRLYSEGKIKLSLKLKQDIFVKILKKDHSFLIEAVDYKNLLKEIFNQVAKNWYEWFYVSKWWIWTEILKSLDISKQNFTRKTKEILEEFDKLFH